MVDRFHLFFDTETTGVLLKGVPLSDPDQPKLVQLAAMLDSPHRETICQLNVLICPYFNHPIPEEATKIHGITTEKATNEGMGIDGALHYFGEMIYLLTMPKAPEMVAHNLAFDKAIIQKAFEDCMQICPSIEGTCTMLRSTAYCGLSGPRGLKWPTLRELYRCLFNDTFDGVHEALADVKACRKCYYELVDRKIIE